MRLEAAVATLALLKGNDGFVQVPFFEIRPECVGDPDLRIRDLPEKKIADSQFAARADQEVRIRLAGGVEILSEVLFGDPAIRRRGPSAVTQQSIHGVDNFGTPAIVKRDIEDHSRILAGLCDRLIEFRLDRRIKLIRASNRAKTNIVLVNVLQLFVEVFLQELHQRRDFCAGTLPVFDGKRIERQRFDFQTSAGLDGNACRLRPRTVPSDPWQVPLLRPPAVAVHNHGHMPREPPEIELFEQACLFRCVRAKRTRCGDVQRLGIVAM